MFGRAAPLMVTRLRLEGCVCCLVSECVAGGGGVAWLRMFVAVAFDGAALLALFVLPTFVFKCSCWRARVAGLAGEGAFLGGDFVCAGGGGGGGDGSSWSMSCSCFTILGDSGLINHCSAKKFNVRDQMKRKK